MSQSAPLSAVIRPGLLYLRDFLKVLQGLHTGHCRLYALDLEVLMKKLVVRVVLMEMLGREHEGYDRDCSIKLYPHQCVNDGLCDKLMSVNTTVIDKASRNDNGKFSCLRQEFRLQRDLKTSGHFVEVNLIGRHTMSADFGDKGVAALIDDLPVPTRLHKRNTFCRCSAFHDVSLLLVPSLRMSREKSWCRIMLMRSGEERASRARSLQQHAA